MPRSHGSVRPADARSRRWKWRSRGSPRSLAASCRRRLGLLMGKLIYLLNVSLDGFVETSDKRLDWSIVDDELHHWFNDRMRELQASIYGRGLYETMAAHWPTFESDPGATPTTLEFGRIWNAMPKF